MSVLLLGIVEGPAARPVLNNQMSVIILPDPVVLLSYAPPLTLSALSTRRRQDIDKAGSEPTLATEARVDKV